MADPQFTFNNSQNKNRDNLKMYIANLTTRLPSLYIDLTDTE